MKPAPFRYEAPETVEEVLALLAEHGDEAKILAGGQSLIPTMNFRLAQPAVLIDLRRVEELAFFREYEDGGLGIGAMTRQREVERSAMVAERSPLVTQTMPWIAHPQIRNQGTFGGSIAHADPSAELPAVIVALGASLKVRNQSGEREVAGADFFTALFETALAPEDLLTEVVLPAHPSTRRVAFTEVSRRHGDYALLGVAAVIDLDAAGRCADARIVYLSAGERPLPAEKAAAVLRGQSPSKELFAAAAEAAASEDLDPPTDIHASKEYRRQLARALTRRVLAQAWN